ALATSLGGDWQTALDLLRPEVHNVSDFGTAAETARIHFLEIALEGGLLNEEVREVAEDLGKREHDPRLAVARETALAAVSHAFGECDLNCGVAARQTISAWALRGAKFQAAAGLILIGPLLLTHRRKGAAESIAQTIRTASDIGVLGSLRARLRYLAPWVDDLAKCRG